jgi:hypothetical protein
LGGKFKYHLFPALTESPNTSGSSSSSQISSFGMWVESKISQHIVFNTAIDLDLYSTNFSGSGSRTYSASSASHSMTTVSLGFEYLF